MTWGIVPPCAEATSKALINARSESVREKRSFKTSFQQRRCLVPADGFYEWTKVGKHPYFFTVNEGSPFATAGIWEAADALPRCCLLTTAAKAVLEPYPRRDAGDRPSRGLGGVVFTRRTGCREIPRITTPYRGGGMSAVAVSPLVNGARVG